MLKRIAPFFLLTVLFCSLLISQPPDPQKLAAFEPKLDYQVRIAQFDGEDSVYQIVRTAERDEILRLFANEVSVMNGRGTKAERFTQYGFFRENGKRVELARGEYFFSFQGDKVYTENFRETQSGNYRFVNLKRYGFVKDRMRREASRYDTLTGNLSPKWYYWDGSYILSPMAQDIFIQDSSFFMVRKSDHPRDILLWFLDGDAGIATLNKLVTLGEKKFAPGFQPEAFGLEEVFATRQHCVVHSLYQQVGRPLGHLFSVFDRSGNLLWETDKGNQLLRSSFPREEIFLVHDHPLLFQQLRCLDARTGQVKWESALYELYNNDPKFEYSVLKSEEVEIAEIYPVNNDEHIAVVIHRKTKENQEGLDPVLFLINRLGQMSYRYEIPQPAKHYKIQTRGTSFSLFTEDKTYLFRLK